MRQLCEERSAPCGGPSSCCYPGFRRHVLGPHCYCQGGISRSHRLFDESVLRRARSRQTKLVSHQHRQSGDSHPAAAALPREWGRERSVHRASYVETALEWTLSVLSLRHERQCWTAPGLCDERTASEASEQAACYMRHVLGYLTHEQMRSYLCHEYAPRENRLDVTHYCRHKLFEPKYLA